MVYSPSLNADSNRKRGDSSTMAPFAFDAKAFPVEIETHSIAEKTGGLRSIFDVSRASLLRLLSARLGSPADAEDLLQELWIKLATLETGPIANPKAYLHRMALNLANDQVRARVRQRGRESAWSDLMVAGHDSVAIDPAPLPDRALIAKGELGRLSRAIQALPDRSQEAFRLHRIEGKGHAEVADSMGISKSAVEKHMATAMKHLVQAMDLEGET